ncbi:MAG: tRNA (adenosine(37)-N6)-threonylcarbamoyltransferase complex dimerization subunit type 1 TsaB [Proteobacteria bacterium]|nr:tRNA (adenosine(37)-N6)-threonylcarbamoyltransferase complex dimerization subunit type 1 TsaB [Pseudomonadota bacterium]MBU1640368.1 tRNA (adenosine(37)-N6)-threonylcarbamoyltransferase complex dimerization subunit type 1 TsaB [Pseudomonadota bacterium]
MAHVQRNISWSPPLILAIDNSTMYGNVALTSADGLLAEHTLLSRLTHSKRLLTSLENILQESDLDWHQLDALAVCLGPGSFTGLRIGLATIKGIAMATGLPLIGISSLDGLASQLPFAKQQICTILDARKHEIYAAFYESNDSGEVERTSDYLVMEPEELIAAIDCPTIFVGDGVNVYADLLKESLGARALFAPEHIIFPRAATIGKLALTQYQQKQFLDPASAVPLYIRASDAEIQLKKKRSTAT